MTESTGTDLTAIDPEQIRVAIEIGEDADLSPRLAAAIDELTEALDEAALAEVSGFAYQKAFSGSFIFDSKLGGRSSTFCSTDGNKQEPYLKSRETNSYTKVEWT